MATKTTENNDQSVDITALVAQVQRNADDVKAMRKQIAALEAEVDLLRRRADVEITEDVLLAISAAVSAYLGNKGKVRAVHFHRHRTWAAQGRQAVQSRKF